jgi:hypothetical protein
MNHLPYKDWLLAEEPLTFDQTQALQDHLRICEACRQIGPAWFDVRALFLKTHRAEPAPGFNERWQTQLAAHKLQKQRRLAWIILGIIAGLSLFLAILFGTELLEVLNSPGSLVLVWVSRITEVLSIYWLLHNLLGVLMEFIPSSPWIGLILGVGMVSFMSVAWLATYRKLTLPRRLG